MTALDTNVVIDLEEGTPDVAEAALRAIELASDRGRVVLCGIVYAELCARPHCRPVDVAAGLAAAHISIDTGLPLDIWTSAGLAYGTYAKRRKLSGGGAARRIMADFIVGAHALSIGSLVTSDVEFYRRAFPELRVVSVR